MWKAKPDGFTDFSTDQDESSEITVSKTYVLVSIQAL